MIQPYLPVPGFRPILGWINAWILTAGAWVLIRPPVSYEGVIGPFLTVVWGTMMSLGGGIALASVLLRRYRVELPGVFASLGGMLIYTYLSWESTFTGSWGSGPRASLLGALSGVLVLRLIWLARYDREVRAVARELDERSD